MELRKNSYDQPHSRRLDELNRLEKGQNDLNLERETDIYQFVHLVRFTDENLQRRLKKPTNVLLTRKFTEEVEETNQCFENSQWRLFLFASPAVYLYWALLHTVS